MPRPLLCILLLAFISAEAHGQFIRGSRGQRTAPTVATFAEQLNPTGDPIAGGKGYSRILTQNDADCTATTYAELAACLGGAAPGDVIFVPRADTIDFSGGLNLAITTDRLTLASDRGLPTGGRDYSQGALLTHSDLSSPSVGTYEEAMLDVRADSVRITGFRLIGGYCGQQDHGYHYGATVNIGIKKTTPYPDSYFEFDNNEVACWEKYGLWTHRPGGRYDGPGGQADIPGTYAHHNFCAWNDSNSFGYCLNHGGTNDSLSYSLYEANFCMENRECIEAHGGAHSYRFRYGQLFRFNNFHHLDRHDSQNPPSYAGRGGLWTEMSRTLVSTQGRFGKWSVSRQYDADMGGHIITGNWFEMPDAMCGFELDFLEVDYRLRAGCPGPLPVITDPDYWDDVDTTGNRSGGEGIVMPRAVLSLDKDTTFAGATVTADWASSSDDDGHAVDRALLLWGDGTSAEGHRGDPTWRYDDSTATRPFNRAGRIGTMLLAGNSYGVFGDTLAYALVYPTLGADYVLTAWLYDTYHAFGGVALRDSVRWRVRVGGSVVFDTTIADAGSFNATHWIPVEVDISAQVTPNTALGVDIGVYVLEDVPTPDSLAGLEAYIDDVYVFGGQVGDGDMEARSVSWAYQTNPGSGCSDGWSTGYTEEQRRSGYYAANPNKSVGSDFCKGGYARIWQQVAFGPQRPAAFAAAPSGPDCTLTWTMPAGSDTTQVLRSNATTGDFATIAKVTGAAFADSAPGAGTWYYAIRARSSSNGVWSNAAQPVSCTVP